MTRAGIALLSELVVLRKRCVFATARDIAEVFGKQQQHENVIAAARKILGNANQPAEFSAGSQNQRVSCWFRHYRYVKERHEPPAFEVTREGLAPHGEVRCP